MIQNPFILGGFIRDHLSGKIGEDQNENVVFVYDSTNDMSTPNSPPFHLISNTTSSLSTSLQVSAEVANSPRPIPTKSFPTLNQPQSFCFVMNAVMTGATQPVHAHIYSDLSASTFSRSLITLLPSGFPCPFHPYPSNNSIHSPCSDFHQPYTY